MPTNPWYNRVNASAPSDEEGRHILERVKKKLVFEKTLRVLGIARPHSTTTSTGSGLYRTAWFTGPSNTWRSRSSTR